MNNKSKKIAITGLLVAGLCILSMLSVSFGGIPYSLSLLGVFLIGGFLTPGYAAGACFCYLLLGLVGIPVFSGFTGGLGVLLGPTGGFLLAYPLMASVIAWVGRMKIKNKMFFWVLGMALALLLGYAMGGGWFAVVTGCSFAVAVGTCVLPFFWFDCIKIAVAVLLLSVKKYYNFMTEFK